MLKVLTIAGGIVAICVVIHVACMISLAEWLLERREWIVRKPGMRREIILLIMVFSIIMLLHLLETAVWAVFYQWWELFPNFENALYFSLTSYTTIGFGDVVLPQRWRLLGGIEGLTGVLLSGLSTAFIFVILNALLQIRLQQPAKN